ncbi:ABC transporter substrate-binding protein [Propionibacteriaceae bacterium Y1700]|uniref:ABC transporter substrate-binding protein n=1 Tax=Microlunatus sp. Y1700 TaxID=3418487 RepID=UPI003DA73141
MTINLNRRAVLGGGLALGASGLLSGCIGASDTTAGDQNANTGAAATIQASFGDDKSRDAFLQIAKEFTGDPKPVVNVMATEQLRAQLSTYLSSAEPPDIVAWYAGAVARDYADKGLLMDLSELWTGDGPCANNSEALKTLCTDESGKQIFVPTSYYWWSIFYFKSSFEKWGVAPPTTWDEFIKLCDTLKDKGVSPLAQGIGSTPWMASGWFDYLNLRINGAQFHRELLAGQHAFDDPKVATVMDQYKRLIPYFDPNMKSYSYQEAITPMVQDKSAMFLIGAFISQSVGDKRLDDLDFFSVPPIDDAIPSAEEAPTDGFFAAAKSKNPGGAKDVLRYLAAPETQQKNIELSGSANLPTSTEVDTSAFSPLVQKGIKLLGETKEITQFFNRDSSDALQLTADRALGKFLDDPSDVSGILKAWQADAKKVFDQ